jgi:hypothetical protein
MFVIWVKESQGIKKKKKKEKSDQNKQLYIGSGYQRGQNREKEQKHPVPESRR